MFVLVMLGSFTYHMWMARKYRRALKEMMALNEWATTAVNNYCAIIFMGHGLKNPTKRCRCAECNLHRKNIGLKEVA